MAKQLNDWLDEFVENGADPKQVIEWPSNAGGDSGIIEVEELPLLGKDGAAYQTEDGSIYTCENVKGKGFIAGKSYMPKSTALGSDFSQIKNGEFFEYHNSSNTGITAGYGDGTIGLLLEFGEVMQPGSEPLLKYADYMYDTSTPESTEVIPTLNNMEQLEPFTFTEEILRAALNQNFDINKIASIFTNPDDIEYSVYTKVGGRSGINENSKLIVDFSQYSTTVQHGGVASADHILYFYKESDTGFYTSEDTVSFIVEANEANTQLIAYWGGSDSYTMISNSVVIYEGDVSQITTTEGLELPTVEFTITDDKYNGCICLPYDYEPRAGITVVY